MQLGFPALAKNSIHTSDPKPATVFANVKPGNSSHCPTQGAPPCWARSRAARKRVFPLESTIPLGKLLMIALEMFFGGGGGVRLRFQEFSFHTSSKKEERELRSMAKSSRQQTGYACRRKSSASRGKSAPSHLVSVAICLDRLVWVDMTKKYIVERNWIELDT